MTRWVFWFLASSAPVFACDASGQRMRSDVQNAPEVFFAVDDIPLAQPFSILITVCNETGMNDLRIDAIMPAHRHGLNYTPAVTALGDGVFRVDNVLFHMPGVWKLQAEFDFSGQSIRYMSDIALK